MDNMTNKPICLTWLEYNEHSKNKSETVSTITYIFIEQ